MKDMLCHLCKQKDQGPSPLSKVRPHYMCDDCYFNPKGTSTKTKIESKEVTVTPHGLRYNKPNYTHLIEVE